LGRSAFSVLSAELIVLLMLVRTKAPLKLGGDLAPLSNYEVEDASNVFTDFNLGFYHNKQPDPAGLYPSQAGQPSIILLIIHHSIFLNRPHFPNLFLRK
jgi:hypothetical protein